jgi:hypothetical protein
MGQGREAAAVRKAILIIVLVAASFLGGAFVNGPGLQWAETRVLRLLGLNNGGEIASVDLKAAVSSETSLDESRSAKPGASVHEGPRAPVPSLLTEHESPRRDGFDQPSTVQTGPKSSSIQSDVPNSGVGPTDALPMKHPFPQTKGLEQEVAPADPNVKQASTSSHPVGSGDSDRQDTQAKPDILDTLAALLPSTSASSASHLPSPSTLPAVSTQKPLVDGSDNWVVLERKMQRLGVSHYTIKGQPGDRVVFSCLIPLAGRQAVAQHFEAEGDDIVQATEATMRRIALWQATQPTSR